MTKKHRVSLVFIIILLAGMLLDLYLPLKYDFKKFDPIAIGQLDQKMWRSYYEKKSFLLFNQLSNLMRKQFHAPFIRSYVMAYHSANAAFIFKNGKGRADYNKALPYLVTYFKSLNDLSDHPFDYKEMARLELEWWIIRRERDVHPTSEWSDILAQESAIFYGLPKEKFLPHSDKRVEAMVLRDVKGDSIAESDWKKIDDICIDAWVKMKAVF